MQPTTNLEVDDAVSGSVELVEHLHFGEEILLSAGQRTPKGGELEGGQPPRLGRRLHGIVGLCQHVVLG